MNCQDDAGFVFVVEPTGLGERLDAIPILRDGRCG